MKRDLVSVMMPAYNAEEYIGEAIQSVLSQTYTTWELIIVDDGSTDGTFEVVRSFQDARIRLFSQPNAGESVARNTALSLMEGEYIAYIDADDVYYPNHLEIAVKALQTNPDWDGVYSDGIHIDTSGRELPTLSSRRRGPFEGWIFDKLAWGSDVFGPPLCVVIRREKVVSRQLEYDPRIVIGPDWDFFLRFAEDAVFGYEDVRTCKYRIHNTNITLRASQQVKLDSLALCRKKAIQLASFSKCPPETRRYVFYDLLINLVRDNPIERDSIMHMPQFFELPKEVQASLLRVAAGVSIAGGSVPQLPQSWLRRSQALKPGELRTLFMILLLSTSPRLAGALSRWRYSGQGNSELFAPFSNMSKLLL